MPGLFRVVVFPRFDGSSGTSIDEGIDLLLRGGEGIPRRELVLYCNTGASIAGFRYDPIVLRQSGRASIRQDSFKTEAQVRAPLSSSGARKRR